jgi:hypothetical protein
VWLHFDAKYRVERLLEILGEDDPEDPTEAGDAEGYAKQQALREDLLKMHAYRDAIRRSSGAYVVYPGDGSGSDGEKFLEYHELLPGLGAFALRPSEQGQTAGEPGVRTFIEDTLRHVGDVLSQDRRATHWVHAAMGGLPKIARTNPISSRAIEGLWFLERPPADEPVAILGNSGHVAWIPEPPLLLFRTDAEGTLPARVLRASWIALVLPDDSVALLRLTDEGVVETPSPALTPGLGTWLAIRATPRETSPAWLTASSIDAMLAGRSSLLLTWADVASRIALGTVSRV